MKLWFCCVLLVAICVPARKAQEMGEYDEAEEHGHSRKYGGEGHHHHRGRRHGRHSNRFSEGMGDGTGLPEDSKGDKITDPGQMKGVSDPGQMEGASDPGQMKGTSDPGQMKGTSDPGQMKGVSYPGQMKGDGDPSGGEEIIKPEGMGGTGDGGDIIEGEEECTVKSLDTLKSRMYIPLTYTIVQSQTDCKLSCEMLGSECVAVGIILYAKVPPPYRKLVAKKFGPKDIVCVRFVRSLFASFLSQGPMSILTKRSTYSLIYEQSCKMKKMPKKHTTGDSKVCPGIGRKAHRIDEFYTISGAAGNTFTASSRSDCEKHCLADSVCTAMWYKPKSTADNCQLYKGDITMQKPKERSFSKKCDATGVCEMKESKYKILGAGEPMNVDKLKECKHRCVSQDWCKGIHWLGYSKLSKCHFLFNVKKLQKNQITVYKCRKSLTSSKNN